MEFNHSDRAEQLIEKIKKFMDKNIYPGESIYKEQLKLDQYKSPTYNWKN